MGLVDQLQKNVQKTVKQVQEAGEEITEQLGVEEEVDKAEDQFQRQTGIDLGGGKPGKNAPDVKNQGTEDKAIDKKDTEKKGSREKTQTTKTSPETVLPGETGQDGTTKDKNQGKDLSNNEQDDQIINEITQKVPENKKDVEELLEKRERNPLVEAASPQFTDRLKTRNQNLETLEDVEKAISNVQQFEKGKKFKIKTEQGSVELDKKRAEELLQQEKRQVRQTIKQNRENFFERNTPVNQNAAENFFNPNKEVSKFKDASEEAELAGRDLALQAQTVGSQTAEVLQSNPATRDIGQGIAADIETVEDFGKSIQDFSQGNVEQALSRTAQTGEDLLVAETDLEKFTPLQASQDLQDQTRFVQKTAVGTPADTAGFFTAVGGGTASIIESEAKQLAGQESGEPGFERISEGTGVLASQVSKQPGKFAKEELIQEGTEAVLTLGAAPVTPTVTPTSTLTSTTDTVTSTARNVGSKTDSLVKQVNKATPGLKNRKGTVDTLTGTETPGPGKTPGPGTKDTIRIDNEIKDITTDTTDTTTTDTTTTETTSGTGTGTVTGAATTTVTDTKDQTVSEPFSRPESSAIDETISRSESITDTVTSAEALTESVTQTQTSTETPTATSTVTQTNTSTPTFRFEGSGEEDENDGGLFSSKKNEKLRESLGAELLDVENGGEDFSAKNPLSLRSDV